MWLWFKNVTSYNIPKVVCDVHLPRCWWFNSSRLLTPSVDLTAVFIYGYSEIADVQTKDVVNIEIQFSIQSEHTLIPVVLSSPVRTCWLCA